MNALVVGIASGIAVLAIGGMVTWALGRRRKVLRCFHAGWRELSRLQAADLLGRRADANSGFRDYYYERPQDARIRKALAAGSSVLVVGEPLSGKTRAALEALWKLPDDCNVAILRESDLDDLRIPLDPRRGAGSSSFLTTLTGSPFGPASSVLSTCWREGASSWLPRVARAGIKATCSGDRSRTGRRTSRSVSR